MIAFLTAKIDNKYSSIYKLCNIRHGSWLDIAEIELNVMTRQCLSCRIADISLPRQELAAWESGRNEHTACIQWQFTTDKARTKLVSLYPKFGNSTQFQSIHIVFLWGL